MRRYGSHQQTGKLLQFLFGLITGLLAVNSALAGEAGQVVSLSGTADVLREARWQPVHTGSLLAEGETIRTGPDSRAAILLASGTQIKLNAHSQLELKRLAPSTEGWVPATAQKLQSILHLLSGEIRVRSSGEGLDIQTAPATATIRGTEFTLGVNQKDSARLAVIQGLVEFHNPQGKVLVAGHEQADAQTGTAPRKTVLLNPLDAVQWSLYYPDRVSASVDQSHRDDPQSSRYWTQAAQQHLLHGQIPEAHQALERALTLDARDAVAYSLRAQIALVQNRTPQARRDAERAIAVNPTASYAWLSLSWVQQAEFDLDGALDSARRAVALDAGNAQALIQESSLLFGMGRLKEAIEVAKRARQQAPEEAMVNTVWGFLELARNRVDAAREAFQAAIGQDSALGLPHLGLGLVWFRHNQTEAALTEMRKATLLEPQVSLYNSYLGKAFYTVRQEERAQKYLDVAKQLDPRDPTPWLYDALRLQGANQPVAAVASLQKSIELNDGRGVYRSRLLLDEDQAARSATLGKIYHAAGFNRLGLQEGKQSLSHDPGNHSAHRLLADSYAAFPNLESARTSELLQAQLLQDININPVQPQMAETRLLMPGTGPVTPSLHEFNPLLVQNGPTLFASALGGSQGTWGNNLMVSGLTDRSSYSLGQFHYQSNGYRPNSDLENNIYNLFVQTAVTPELNLQAEYRYRETINGDLRSSGDGSYYSSQRYNVEQETARVGARYSLSPQTDVIASVVYIDHDTLIRYPKINLALDKKIQGFQAETQFIYRTDSFNVTTGLGMHSYDEQLTGFPESTANQRIAYSYANIKAPEQLIWTLGLSYEADDNPAADLNALNPKLGVQWTINEQISLRAAAFKAVKRPFPFHQSIEPTHVAGFNQVTDHFDMTSSRNYGLGLNIRFNDQLLGGIEALRRDNKVPFGILAQPEFYEIVRNREDAYDAYLYWLPAPHWAISVAGRYEKFRVTKDCARCLFLSPRQMETFSAPLSVQYFNPSGFFSSLGVVYVHQNVDALGPNLSKPMLIKNSFALVNTGLGYQFPRRQGVIDLQINNLFDKEFNFQDSSFEDMNRSSNPLYIPERTVSARLTVEF